MAVTYSEIQRLAVPISSLSSFRLWHALCFLEREKIVYEVFRITLYLQPVLGIPVIRYYKVKSEL